MPLSKGDPANCVRAILNFVLRRWLWLMPSPATALCLRETENRNHWLLNPAWAWTLCEYIILQCWVIPAKDISSACNWFVYIYKNLFRNAPVMHVLRAGCSQNSSASPVDSAGLIAHSTREGSWSPGSGAHRAVFSKVTGISLLVGLRFALVLVSAWYVQNVRNGLHHWYDTAFPEPPIHFVDFMCLWPNNHSNNNNTFFSILLARKHTYLSKFFSFEEKIK